MGDIGTAVEGAIALIMGGTIFLLFGQALQGIGVVNLTFWGFVYFLCGVLVLVILLGALIGGVLGRIP